jgi:hypothetical protein
MSPHLVEDRELPLDSHDNALFTVVELEGKRMIDDAATHGELFERQMPSLIALL